MDFVIIITMAACTCTRALSVVTGMWLKISFWLCNAINSLISLEGKCSGVIERVQCHLGLKG